MSLQSLALPLPRRVSWGSSFENLLKPFRELNDWWKTLERAKFDIALGLARRSANALEREIPGSVANLNPSTLRIEHQRKCALAQVYGRYTKAPDRLLTGPIGDGFLVKNGLAKRHMNNAWRIVIAEARAA